MSNQIETVESVGKTAVNALSKPSVQEAIRKSLGTVMDATQNITMPQAVVFASVASVGTCIVLSIRDCVTSGCNFHFKHNTTDFSLTHAQAEAI